MGCLGTLIVMAIIMAILEAIASVFSIIVIIFVFIIFAIGIAKLKPIEKYKIYRFKKFEERYYASEEFVSIRKKVNKYVENCNELNKHIKKLKKTHLGIRQVDYGKASYYDNSDYNYSRPEFEKHSQAINVYNCSRNICDSARIKPFKYICKYFEIYPTEKTLSEFENLLNNFEAAINGMKILQIEKTKILSGIENEIPKKIKENGYYRFQLEIGFEDIEIEKIDFPKYKFQYISSGGYAHTECEVVMDIQNLNKFISYLSEKIKFKNSVAGQRALMTSSLRRKILNRDNYTCQKCGNSTFKEPNLLLEIDHKVPLSKGGMTTENNLQVLCWRCNRSKGAKIE